MVGSDYYSANDLDFRGLHEDLNDLRNELTLISDENGLKIYNLENVVITTDFGTYDGRNDEIRLLYYEADNFLYIAKQNTPSSFSTIISVEDKTAVIETMINNNFGLKDASGINNISINLFYL